MVKDEKATVQSQAPKLIAVIRVRGDVKVSIRHKRTLELLRLHKRNRCIVLPGTASNIGMLNKVKDYCTYGEIDEKTLASLIEKRGRLAGNKPISIDYLKEKLKLQNFEGFASVIMHGKAKLTDLPGAKPFFKLHPPIKGFERQGIKQPFSVGGALGYRREKINELIRRMI